MIRITQMKLPITNTEEQLQKKITKTLRLGNTPFTYKIHKQSLDARHKLTISDVLRHSVDRTMGLLRK